MLCDDPRAPLERVLRIARAIATAEGFFDPNPDAIPRLANNPGDLMLGNRFGVQVTHRGAIYIGTINGVTIYPKADWNADIEDHEDGCAALYREIRAILCNQSYVYAPAMTIAQVGDKWTDTDPDDWAKTVSAKLGIAPDTKMCEIA